MAVFMAVRLIYLVVGIVDDDIYHNAKQLTDGMEKTAASVEQGSCAGSRGCHDDVHRTAVYSDPAGGDGQDYEGPDGQRSGF